MKAAASQDWICKAHFRASLETLPSLNPFLVLNDHLSSLRTGLGLVSESVSLSEKRNVK